MTTPLTCDGSTDDAPAILTFHDWAVNTWQASHSGLIELFIPSGKTCVLNGLTSACEDVQSPNLSCPFSNILDLVVSGYGSTLKGSNIVSLGGLGEYGDNQHDARTQSASAGATCVNLVIQPLQTISNVAPNAHTTISAVGNNGSGKVRLTVSSTTGFSTGQLTNIQGVTGTPSANSVQVATVVNGTTIDLLLVAFVSSGVTSGSVDGFAVVTVSDTTGYVSGQKYKISGVAGIQAINDGFMPLTVADSTHLNLTQLAFIGTYGGGGKVGDVTAPFVVGRYGIMTGFDLQGLQSFAGFGFPIDAFYFNYVKLTSVDSNPVSGTYGRICFDRALTHDYLSTWPSYDTGSNPAGLQQSTDQGGPATLYMLQANWDTSVEIRGMTIDRPSDNTFIVARQVVLRDMVMTGVFCVVPTQQESFTVIDSDYSTCSDTGSGLEIDKMNVAVTWQGGTAWGFWFQSSTTDVFTATGTVITNKITGTPRKFVGTNITIPSFSIGAQGFGRTDEVTCTGCNIGSIANGAIFVGPTSSNEGVNNATGWSMAGGVITIPNIWSFNTSTAIGRWAVPGTNFCFQGSSGDCEALGQVTGVTQDATNTYIATTFPGTWPSVPELGGTKLFIGVHPAPKFTCTGCTGVGGATASNWTAGAPLYSSQVISYSGTGSATTFGNFPMWGNLVSLSINVTNAYTGSGSLSWHLSAFDNWPTLGPATTYTETNYAPVANAKIAGNRAITLSGVTGTQSGDGGLSVPNSTQTWFEGRSPSGPFYSADVTAFCAGTPAGCPSVTVTFQTNQGVVNPPN